MARAATPEEIVKATAIIDEMLSETLTLSPIDIVRLTELMAADLGMIGGEDVDYGQL